MFDDNLLALHFATAATVRRDVPYYKRWLLVQIGRLGLVLMLMAKILIVVVVEIGIGGASAMVVVFVVPTDVVLMLILLIMAIVVIVLVVWWRCTGARQARRRRCRWWRY